MSRYVASTKDGKELAFGYDRPLQEYFVQVFDENDELILDINSSGQSMVNSPTRPYSNSAIHSELLYLMDAVGVERYKAQLEDILMDLPI